MKFEYRYLSEERAAEIDAMGIITCVLYTYEDYGE